MNRRTFLQAAAITTVGIPTLSIAKSKQKPRWISLEEQFPKKGQHIITLDVWKRMNTHLRMGMVKSIHSPPGYPGKYLLLQVDFSLYRHDYKGPLNGHYDLTLNSNSAHYSLNEILSTPWVKTNKAIDMSMGTVPFYSRPLGTKEWWLPAPDRIPKTLPPFPFDEPKWIKFTTRMPKEDEIIFVRDRRGEVKKVRMEECLWGYNQLRGGHRLAQLHRFNDRQHAWIDFTNDKWYWRYVS